MTILKKLNQIIKDIGLLYFKPTAFFKDSQLCRSESALYIVWFLYAASVVVNKIESSLMFDKASGVEGPFIGICETWWGVWFVVLVGSAVVSLFSWYIWALIFRFFVWLAGHKGANWQHCRQVLVFSLFSGSIVTLPTLLFYTLFFDSYLLAWQFDMGGIYTFLVVFLPVWSFVITYRGVMAFFDVKVWRAQLIFLWVPIFVYFASIVWTAYFYL